MNLNRLIYAGGPDMLRSPDHKSFIREINNSPP